MTIGGPSHRFDVEQLRSDIDSGRTLTSIAAEHGVSHQTVSRAAKRAGIVVPRRPPPTTRRRPHPQLDDPGWLAANYATHQVNDIAEALGVSPSTVYEALHRHGIPVRDPGASQRLRRPAQLQNPDWLRWRYEQSSGTTIADELGVDRQMVYAALVHHGIERRDHSAMQRFRSPTELDDAEWLRQRFNEVSAPIIADELGVTRRTVYIALERHGVDVARSPWVNHGYVRLTPPDETTLRGFWETEETIKGVARQVEVSVNTAAVWLADIGVFIKDTPVISRRDSFSPGEIICVPSVDSRARDRRTPNTRTSTPHAQHALARPLAGGEALDRRKPTADISPLVACELAVWKVLAAPVVEFFVY